MSWRTLPASSRLSGVWRVTIVQIDNLHMTDMKKGVLASDPVCHVHATSESPRLSYWEETCVKLMNLNPRYDETFELPIAKNPGYLEAALRNFGDGFSTSHFDHLFPAHGGMHRYSYSRIQWKRRINSVANDAISKSAHDARSWVDEHNSSKTLLKVPEPDPPTPKSSLDITPTRTTLSLKEAIEKYSPNGIVLS